MGRSRKDPDAISRGTGMSADSDALSPDDREDGKEDRADDGHAVVSAVRVDAPLGRTIGAPGFYIIETSR